MVDRENGDISSFAPIATNSLRIAMKQLLTIFDTHYINSGSVTANSLKSNTAIVIAGVIIRSCGTEQ